MKSKKYVKTSVLWVLMLGLFVSLLLATYRNKVLEEMNSALLTSLDEMQRTLNDNQQVVIDREKEIRKLKDELLIFLKGKKDSGFTKSEIRAINRMVEAEATSGSEEHKLIVANVIKNRVVDKNFPNTTHEVLFDWFIKKKNGKRLIVHQFSPIGDNRYYFVTPTKTTISAVKRMLNGEDNSQGALFFMNPKGSTEENVKWFDENRKFLFAKEGHRFYR